MKVLVIQQKMIGDVLTSSILCENIKNKMPNSEVHYVVNTHTLAVVNNNPYIDKLVIFKEEYRKSKFKFYTFLKEMKKENYDVVIDVYAKLESNLITFFAKAPITISNTKWYSKFIYNHSYKNIKSGDSVLGLAIENRLKLLEPILPNAENLITKPAIYLTTDEISDAKSFLEDHDIDLCQPILMINVLGSDKTKTYPLSYMAEVLDYITEYTGAVLLFNYAPNQVKEAKELYHLCKEKTREHIKFDVYASSLRSFLSILHHCQALIGNEGGGVNMAKALDKPTFSIFSPWITKEAWNLYKDNANVAIHLKDYFPEKINNKSQKEIRKEYEIQYQNLKPVLFKEKLKNFLSLEVISNQ
ncbi:MAG: glycosyltransferase family 9 protein [Cellulophaga sp.]